jgi:calcium permeable stress-gated cation channel
MVDAKTLGFLWIVGLGLVVGFLCLAVFLCVRPRLPQVYQFRRLLNRYRTYNDFNGARVGFPSKRPEAGMFGWLGPTLATREDEVVRRIGLDAAMFLRFMRSQLLSFAIAAVFCCALLWPVYATGSNKDLPALADGSDDPKSVGGLQILSLSNVPVGNGRIWATLTAEYVVCAVFLYFLYKDYAQYAEYRRQYRTAENPGNYSLVVYDIPAGMNTEEAVRERFELMVPGQVAEVVMARKARKGMEAEKVLATMIAKKERAQFLRASTGDEPMTRAGTCGACMCWKPKVPAVEYFEGEQERLEAKIADEGRSAANANSAVVVFTNKRAASLIAQANQGGNADEWTVHRAGEPEAVHWPAFHIPGYQAVWRSVAVIGFVFFLTFFWIIPATAIMGLANLESLSKLSAFSWAKKVRDLSPAVVGLVENALPAIILSVFLSLIPTFIRLALSQTRLHSAHLIDSKTRNYFYVFSIFASFVFIVIGAAALTELKGIIDDPAKITKLLASGVPRNGLFFASFVIVKTFIPLALLLLNPGRVIVRWIKLKFAKTERERRAAEETGSIFQYFQFYGQSMMMSLLGLTYSTLAPLVTLCVLVYYLMAFAVFKHNIIFASHRKWDGGGWDYPGAFYSVIASLLIKQLTMIGVLGLYEAPGETVLAIVPLVVTALFGMWCHKRFNRVSLHGSLHDQYAAGSKVDEIPTRYQGLYRQPGVALQPYQNLSGMEDPRDVYADEDEDGFESDAHLKSEHHDTSVGYVPDRAGGRRGRADDV